MEREKMTREEFNTFFETLLGDRNLDDDIMDRLEEVREKYFYEEITKNVNEGLEEENETLKKEVERLKETIRKRFFEKVEKATEKEEEEEEKEEGFESFSK